MTVTRVILLAVCLGGATNGHANDRPQSPATATSTAADGSRLYAEYCAACHGSEGRGDGPMATGLTTPPSNLRRLTVAYGGIFPAARIRETIDGRTPPLLHGTRDMPIWGDAFKRTRGPHGERRVEERLDLLVDYLQTLQEY